MHVLAIEPYYGGSHRQFLDTLHSISRHRWTRITRPARHWKWRMRSAAADVIADVIDAIDRHGVPDVLFCSDMLDLPTFLGCAAADDGLSNRLLELPRVAYFHENQWQYPKAPDARVDHHYGFTNLLTASVADVNLFNSRFNLESFLERSRDFLARMPDARDAVDLDSIERTSRIIPPGFHAPLPVARDSWRNRPLRIGWVGRFEHDKRPDRFVELLKRLQLRSVGFELILLGERGRKHQHVDALHQHFAPHVLYDGFAPSRSQYEAQLAKMDIVVSTADHEFFGVAVCEAIWSGAIPVTPDALAYREYVPESLRYGGIEQAADIIEALAKRSDVETLRGRSREAIEGYRSEQIVSHLDDLVAGYDQ